MDSAQHFSITTFRLFAMATTAAWTLSMTKAAWDYLFGEEMDNEVANPPIEGLPVLLPDGKTSNHAFVFRAPTFEIRGDELPAALASRVGQFIQGECDTRAREADARARAMELRSWKSVLSEFRRFLALPFLGVAIFAVFQSRSGQEMVAALIRD